MAVHHSPTSVVPGPSEPDELTPLCPRKLPIQPTPQPADIGFPGAPRSQRRCWRDLWWPAGHSAFLWPCLLFHLFMSGHWLDLVATWASVSPYLGKTARFLWGSGPP